MTSIDADLDAAALTDELAKLAWSAVPSPATLDNTPYATHEAVLDVLGIPMRCHRLNTGQVVFLADDFNKLLRLMGVTS